VAKLDTLRTAFDGQVDAVATWLGAVPDASWATRSRLGDWTVHELAVHLVMSPAAMTAALQEARPTGRPQSIAQYTSRWTPAADEIAARGRERAGAIPPAELLIALRESATELGDALSALSDDAVIAGNRGPIRASDLLVTRVNELVVHSLDLSASVPEIAPVPLDRQAVGVACRMLTGILAEQAPGHSVEVRVPPYAAVQCVEGPRHTRGTPANVVEIEPSTWIELATGRLTWSAARATRRVSASGERADISAYLPVLS
jgi:uncharacterized protein (TIGR03083 family)